MPQKTHRRHYKQVRAIVVFGDLRGFSVWEQSITRPELEFQPLVSSFDEMVDTFEDETGYFTKNLGDGFMQVIELPEGHVCHIAKKVLEDVLAFSGAMNRLVNNSDWPRPAGFRVRLSAGYVWKKEGDKTDYLGRYVNLTHKILRVMPDEEIVSHQSFVELMKKKHAKELGVKFTLTPSSKVPDGVLKADALRLWTIKRVRK